MIQVSSFFKNQDLLQKALVHRSYCNEHPGLASNERLEFLGDSVLSVVISHRLFDLLPQVSEGELTSRRSYLVQTASLATKAKMLGLDKMFLLSRGEEESGGRANTGLLANTFEAVLGALFLDQGLLQAEEFLKQVFPDEELISAVNTKDPKSLLQERVQAKGLGTPIYKTLSAEGPDHAKKFTVAVVINDTEVATGVGPSKQKAEAAAAEAGLTSDFMVK
jgi:ribonuclease-3